MNNITFKPIEPWIGAVVSGVNLTNPLDQKTISALKVGLAKNRVLVFHGQDISREQHVAMARAFGEPEPHPSLSVEGYPEIVPIQQKTDMPLYGQLGDWHTDVTYKVVPPKVAILRGFTIPQVGGSTGFVNTVRAYATLDEATRSRLRGLKAVHAPDFENYITDPERLKSLQSQNPAVEHPVVIKHPVTGEEILYVNEHFTKRIVGMREEESRSLLDRLFFHLTHLEFQMRVKWKENTVVMWDERSTLHYAVADYSEPRYLERILVKGEAIEGA